MSLNLGTLRVVPIDEIEYVMEERGREQLGDIEALGKLISSHGLIHPIAVYSPTLTAPYKLVAGGRRTLACKALGWKEISVRIYDTEMTEQELTAIELFENLGRQNLTYAETVKLKTRMHRLLVDVQKEKQKADPAERGHTLRDTAHILGESHATVLMDMKLSDAMEQFPEFGLDKLPTKTAAMQAWKRIQSIAINRYATKNAGLVAQSAPAVEVKENPRYEAAKARAEAKTNAAQTRVLPAAAPREALAPLRTLHTPGPERPSDIVVGPVAAPAHPKDAYILGDFFCNQLAENQFSLIECDPPYGIDLQALRKQEGVDSTLQHSYVEIGSKEYSTFLYNLSGECYKLAAPNAYMLLWIAPQHLGLGKLALEANGFDVCPVPAIWKKGKTAGQSNSSNTNLGNSYEMLLYARKGSAQLLKRGRSNVFDFPGVHSSKRIHPTERPEALMRELLATFGWRDTSVLVPFAGSGNTIVCAYELRMTAVGFDLSREFYEAYLVRLLKKGLVNG